MKDSIVGMSRQGDVLVMNDTSNEVGEEVPSDAGRTVLAYGEVTGHAHALPYEEARLYKDKAGSSLRMHLRLVSPTAFLKHEEHAPIEIDNKPKEVRIQRQWTSERIRQVQD